MTGGLFWLKRSKDFPLAAQFVFPRDFYLTELLSLHFFVIPHQLPQCFLFEWPENSPSLTGRPQNRTGWPEQSDRHHFHLFDGPRPTLSPQNNPLTSGSDYSPHPSQFAVENDWIYRKFRIEFARFTDLVSADGRWKVRQWHLEEIRKKLDAIFEKMSSSWMYLIKDNVFFTLKGMVQNPFRSVRKLTLQLT